MLIDDLDGTVHRANGAAWDALYVIDADGTVVLLQVWTHPGEVEEVLDELAAGRFGDPTRDRRHGASQLRADG